MDKDWMNLPRFGKEYIDGVSSFLDFAFTRGNHKGERFYALVLSVAMVDGKKGMLSIVI